MRISLFVSILLLSGCVCAPVVTDDAVQLPCCGSVNDSQAVNISTGVGPWRVTVPWSLTSQPVVPAGDPAWVTMSDPVWSPSIPVSWVGAPRVPREQARHDYPDPGDQGDYVYELRFNAPACQFARTITVSGNVASDNRATIYFGAPGRPAVASQSASEGFLAANVIPFSTTEPRAWREYLLTVVVHNDGGPTGLALQAIAVSRCEPPS